MGCAARALSRPGSGAVGCGRCRSGVPRAYHNLILLIKPKLELSLHICGLSSLPRFVASYPSFRRHIQVSIELHGASAVAPALDDAVQRSDAHGIRSGRHSSRATPPSLIAHALFALPFAPACDGGACTC
eukprot:6178080-Pleurochrysis_carterae.AAC.3